MLIKFDGDIAIFSTTLMPSTAPIFAHWLLDECDDDVFAVCLVARCCKMECCNCLDFFAAITSDHLYLNANVAQYLTHYSLPPPH